MSSFLLAPKRISYLTACDERKEKQREKKSRSDGFLYLIGSRSSCQDNPQSSEQQTRYRMWVKNSQTSVVLCLHRRHRFLLPLATTKHRLIILYTLFILVMYAVRQKVPSAVVRHVKSRQRFTLRRINDANRK